MFRMLYQKDSYVDDCQVPPAPFEELLNTYVSTTDRTQKYTSKKQTIVNILAKMIMTFHLLCNLKIL